MVEDVVISASLLRRPVLPMVYSSLWSMWATDLLRQAKNPLIHEIKIINSNCNLTFIALNLN